MADFTDEVTQPCEIEAVFALDVLDTSRMLQIEHVSVDETLDDCGCGDTECAILKTFINKKRAATGRAALTDEQPVAPATTIRQVMSYVC